MEKWKALINHTIEALDKRHAIEIYEFYQSIGVTLEVSAFVRYKSDGDTRRFYMVRSNGGYDYWSESESKVRNLKFVTLEEAKRIVDGGSSIISTTESSINISTTKIVGRIIC